MTLEDIGWNAAFEMEFAPFRAEGWKPARLIRDNKISYGAMIEGGDERDVVLGGKVYHDAETDADLPAVGDWVALARELASGPLNIPPLVPAIDAHFADVYSIEAYANRLRAAYPRVLDTAE